MQPQAILNLMEDWMDELRSTLVDSSILCVALFSSDGNIVFSNSGMSYLLEDKSGSKLINPTFEKLYFTKSPTSLVYEGFLTFGNYVSVNTSILAKVYRKNNQLLVIGGVDTTQLVVQNESMHHLNREISNLQRQLIKEKYTLETTLKRLNEVNRELKDLNATKDKFFSIISHDLKNPFNSILGFSELLLEYGESYTPEVVTQFAQTIHTASKEAHQLLENLLEWSRIQTGRLIPKQSNVELPELLEEVRLLCVPMAATKEIRMVICDAENLEVHVDKEMIKTVIRNLVTNAIKFTHLNGTVSIDTFIEAGFLVVSVADTGTGIDNEFLYRLFDIDRKLTKSGTIGESGSGLGLLLCKEFVEQNGGRIWVESELGKGSIFNFTIPLSRSINKD